MDFTETVTIENLERASSFIGFRNNFFFQNFHGNSVDNFFKMF